MELLSPAGSYEHFETALRYGADAVYFGMKKLGLRAFAGNFTNEETVKAIQTAHRQNKRVYVTLNAFLYDEDLDSFIAQAKFLQEAGADAAIVSDPASVSLAAEFAPKLTLHLSTQANTLNSRSAAFWHQNGVKRVILARELSLARIQNLRKNTPESLELEAFVHGAMCVSYSGRCVLSNYLTGRDSNQGACAQPCRWNYTLMEEKRPGVYLPITQEDGATAIYASDDLNMIAHLEDLKQAGLCSIKIEGRMKTPYYVATVVHAYRKALDDCLNGRPFDESLLAEVACASHRHSGTGFYYDKPTTPPGDNTLFSHATYVAKVLDAQKGLCEQRNRIFAGEKLEVLSPSKVLPFALSPLLDAQTGQEMQSAPHPKQLFITALPEGTHNGDFIRRNKGADLPES